MLDLVQLRLQIISSVKALMTGVLPQGQTSMLITFVFQLLNGAKIHEHGGQMEMCSEFITIFQVAHSALIIPCVARIINSHS